MSGIDDDEIPEGGEEGYDVEEEIEKRSTEALDALEQSIRTIQGTGLEFDRVLEDCERYFSGEQISFVSERVETSSEVTSRREDAASSPLNALISKAGELKGITPEQHKKIINLVNDLASDNNEDVSRAAMQTALAVMEKDWEEEVDYSNALSGMVGEWLNQKAAVVNAPAVTTPISIPSIEEIPPISDVPLAEAVPQPGNRPDRMPGGEDNNDGGPKGGRG